MMNFLDLAKKRYSTRNFLQKPVSDADQALILEAGRVAPTAANRQPQIIIVIDDPEALNKLANCCNVFSAPLAFVVCVDHQLSWKRSYDAKDAGDIDASIVTTHMMLQAAELGLGSCWICMFNPKLLRESFNIPDHIEPVNILVVGNETGKPKSPDRHDTQRHPLSEMIVKNTF